LGGLDLLQRRHEGVEIDRGLGPLRSIGGPAEPVLLPLWVWGFILAHITLVSLAFGICEV
jgi:hypothetical protein